MVTCETPALGCELALPGLDAGSSDGHSGDHRDRLTLTMMPWEHGAVRFLKDSALRVTVGLAIVLNAAAIVATMAGG